MDAVEPETSDSNARALPRWRVWLDRWGVIVQWPDGGSFTLGHSLTRRGARKAADGLVWYQDLIEPAARWSVRVERLR